MSKLQTQCAYQTRPTSRTDDSDQNMSINLNIAYVGSYRRGGATREFLTLYVFYINALAACSPFFLVTADAPHRRIIQQLCGVFLCEWVHPLPNVRRCSKFTRISKSPFVCTWTARAMRASDRRYNSLLQTSLSASCHTPSHLSYFFLYRPKKI